MPQTVNFKFAIGETVKILGIDMFGTVTALLQDETGRCYRVVYWNNNTRTEQSLYEFEIRAKD